MRACLSDSNPSSLFLLSPSLPPSLSLPFTLCYARALSSLPPSLAPARSLPLAVALPRPSLWAQRMRADRREDAPPPAGRRRGHSASGAVAIGGGGGGELALVAAARDTLQRCRCRSWHKEIPGRGSSGREGPAWEARLLGRVGTRRLEVAGG